MRSKRGVIATGVVVAALAGPGTGVAAADFVCPVLGANGHNGAQGVARAADNNPNLQQIGGGDWSVIGPEVGNGGVPDRATNTLPDGRPGDPNTEDHASPGDTGYTAIWNTD
jgi:hypothetical protein